MPRTKQEVKKKVESKPKKVDSKPKKEQLILGRF
jgi:hypothetical protein